jgi:hypothetical protein
MLIILSFLVRLLGPFTFRSDSVIHRKLPESTSSNGIYGLSFTTEAWTLWLVGKNKSSSLPWLLYPRSSTLRLRPIDKAIFFHGSATLLVANAIENNLEVSFLKVKYADIAPKVGLP